MSNASCPSTLRWKFTDRLYCSNFLMCLLRSSTRRRSLAEDGPQKIARRRSPAEDRSQKMACRRSLAEDDPPEAQPAAGAHRRPSIILPHDIGRHQPEMAHAPWDRPRGALGPKSGVESSVQIRN